jgi:hypothetical protein
MKADLRITWVLCCFMLALAADAPSAAVAADKSPAITDAAKAGPEYELQGEFVGTLKFDGQEAKYGCQVIALGDGKFKAVVYPGGLPGEGWEKTVPTIEHDGKLVDGAVEFKGEHAVGKLTRAGIEVSTPDGNAIGQLERVERKSPTLGAKPPEGAVVLFDGSSADAFVGGKLSPEKLLEAGVKSKQSFGDCHLHLEFRTPYMPTARGQGRGNSGVYLQNRYELQVLDSFGLEGKDNECGGFYSVKAPALNMCYPPLAWQTYDIDFATPRFDSSGKKTKNAVVTVKHNGVTIHDNLEMPKLTPGGDPQESPKPGVLQLQDHGNPVHFRNIWIVEK